MKPAKLHGASKHHKICWIICDRAQSCVLRSYNVHELHNRNVSIWYFLVRSKQVLCFVYGQGQKSGQKHQTKNLIGPQNHSPL